MGELFVKRKKWLISGGAVVLLVCAFFIFGMATHSKADYYIAFKQALKDKNAEEMKNLLTTRLAVKLLLTI